MSSTKSKRCPVRKIITDHLIQQQKVPNSSSHYFYQCNYCSTCTLDIAKQWRWNEQPAKMLVADLKEYHKCSGALSGGQADALDWWEILPVSAERCPLKAFAIIIHSIVLHAADVERYFPGLVGYNL
ncbi:hypothetical protein BDR04DRAFT_1101331 [Suillus decipiens]|nr:hypothetical protein BDR04DRAFT_1101331 [Suillus decipiens]